MEGGCVTQKKRNDEYARLTTMKEHGGTGKRPELTSQRSNHLKEQPPHGWGSKSPERQPVQ